MKKILFLTLALLPVTTKAQSGPGVYALNKEKTKTLSGQLQISDNELEVMEDGKSKAIYNAKDVFFVKIKENRYVPLSGFDLKSAIFGKQTNPVFVEVLSSGPYTLFSYLTTSTTSYGSTARNNYLVRISNSDSLHVLPLYSGLTGSKKLREKLKQYAVQRPDLIDFLNNGKFTEASMQPFFRALNSGQPLASPTKLP